jgi:hypothetical protein
MHKVRECNNYSNGGAQEKGGKMKDKMKLSLPPKLLGKTSPDPSYLVW